jgi:hypothetical protein
MPPAIASFTAPALLLGYVDGLSRVPGDRSARFCGGDSDIISLPNQLGLKELPALEALRQIWLQQYYRCTVPGLEALRWRTSDEQPPSAVRIASPYDLEARQV